MNHGEITDKPNQQWYLQSSQRPVTRGAVPRMGSLRHAGRQAAKHQYPFRVSSKVENNCL